MNVVKERVIECPRLMNDFNEQILRIPRLMNDFNEQILRFVNPKLDVRKVIRKPCKTLYTVNVRLMNTNMAQRYFGQKTCVPYEFSLTAVSWLVNFLSNTRLANILGLTNVFKFPKSFVTQELGVYKNIYKKNILPLLREE